MPRTSIVEILVSTGHLVRGKAARSLSWEVQGSLMTVSVSSLTVRPGWWSSRHISSQKEKLNMNTDTRGQPSSEGLLPAECSI